MQVIQNADGKILKTLGKARPVKDALRWMKYVIPYAVEDGVFR